MAQTEYGLTDGYRKVSPLTIMVSNPVRNPAETGFFFPLPELGEIGNRRKIRQISLGFLKIQKNL